MKHHQDPLPDMTRLKKDEQGLKVIEPKDVPVKLVEGQLYTYKGYMIRPRVDELNIHHKANQIGGGRVVYVPAAVDPAGKPEEPFVHPLDRDQGFYIRPFDPTNDHVTYFSDRLNHTIHIEKPDWIGARHACPEAFGGGYVSRLFWGAILGAAKTNAEILNSDSEQYQETKQYWNIIKDYLL